jgi:hypothetical protein
MVHRMGLTGGPSTQSGWSPAIRGMKRTAQVSNLTLFSFVACNAFTTVETLNSFLSWLLPAHDVVTSEKLLKGSSLLPLVCEVESGAGSLQFSSLETLKSQEGSKDGGDSLSDSNRRLTGRRLRPTLVAKSNIVSKIDYFVTVCFVLGYGVCSFSICPYCCEESKTVSGGY